jgi:hypothetical protein
MDDQDVREELAGQLVEALMHLRAEADAEEPAAREAFVNERYAPIRYLFDEAARGRVLERAEVEHGAEFAAWTAQLMKRFDATEPPLSMERPKR